MNKAAVFINILKVGYVKKLKDSFFLLMPPPNITGSLTVGHVLNKILQDVILKFNFQKKKLTAWVPGTDHAGISTQNQVIKNYTFRLKCGNSLKKYFFKREVLKWSFQYRKIITDQLKQVKILCSWNFLKYSYSTNLNVTVLKSFIKLYLNGFIYKHTYTTNWCFENRSSLSDENVCLKNTVQSSYKVKYSVVGLSKAWVYLYTSRVETLPGDVNICLSKTDFRYKGVLSFKVKNMFNGMLMDIVLNKNACASFGTGVVKLTPGHSKKDMLIASQNKNYKPINIFTKQGRLNFKTGTFKNLDVSNCKYFIVSTLVKLKFLKTKGFYSSLVSYTKKYNFKVQPLLSTQWFLKYPSVLESINVARGGLMKLHPPFWSKIYLKWLVTIRTWCISRQSWWGHKVPVFYKKYINSDVYISHTKKHLTRYFRDGNKLDTWFSSWLWNLTTLGWPTPHFLKSSGLRTYSLVVTGSDIIFFWIVRMVIAGLFFLGKTTKRVPFEKVYFTGILRDSNKNKISKSLGNSPNLEKLVGDYGMSLLKSSFLSVNLDADFIFKSSFFENQKNFLEKVRNSQIVLNNKVHFFYWRCGKRIKFKDILKSFNSLVLNSLDLEVLNRLLGSSLSWDKECLLLNFKNALTGIKYFFKNSLCNTYLNYTKLLKNNNKTSVIVLLCFIFTFSKLLPILEDTSTLIYKKCGIQPNFLISNVVKLKKILFKGTNFIEERGVIINTPSPLLDLSNVTSSYVYVPYINNLPFLQYSKTLLKVKLLLIRNKKNKVAAYGSKRNLPFYIKKPAKSKNLLKYNTDILTYVGSTALLYKNLLIIKHHRFASKFISLKINKLIILRQKTFDYFKKLTKPLW